MRSMRLSLTTDNEKQCVHKYTFYVELITYVKTFIAVTAINLRNKAYLEE